MLGSDRALGEGIGPVRSDSRWPALHHEPAQCLCSTWHVGKWPLGGRRALHQDHGSDVNIGRCEAGSPYPGGYFSPWSIPPLQNADVPDRAYLTDCLTDQAIDLIRHSRDSSFFLPSFLNLWTYCAHTPIQAKHDKILEYEDKAKLMGLDTLQAFEQGDFFPCEQKSDQRILRHLIRSDPLYAAMIERLDDSPMTQPSMMSEAITRRSCLRPASQPWSRAAIVAGRTWTRTIWSSFARRSGPAGCAKQCLHCCSDGESTIR